MHHSICYWTQTTTPDRYRPLIAGTDLQGKDWTSETCSVNEWIPNQNWLNNPCKLWDISAGWENTPRRFHHNSSTSFPWSYHSHQHLEVYLGLCCPKYGSAQHRGKAICPWMEESLHVFCTLLHNTSKQGWEAGKGCWVFYYTLTCHWICGKLKHCFKEL